MCTLVRCTPELGQSVLAAAVALVVTGGGCTPGTVHGRAADLVLWKGLPTHGICDGVYAHTVAGGLCGAVLVCYVLAVL